MVFLAGSNGAGKTTFFEHYLEPLGLPFVNADRIAERLRAAAPALPSAEVERRAFDEAERLRAALLDAGLSFCTETVFSDPVGSKIGFLREARRRGFFVLLFFIGIESVALSIARVQQRVTHGGHDIRDDRLRARFARTLANLGRAVPVVDEAVLVDNSSYEAPYRPVAIYRDGRLESRYPPLPGWTAGLPGL